MINHHATTCVSCGHAFDDMHPKSMGNPNACTACEDCFDDYQVGAHGSADFVIIKAQGSALAKWAYVRSVGSFCETYTESVSKLWAKKVGERRQAKRTQPLTIEHSFDIVGFSYDKDTGAVVLDGRTVGALTSNRYLTVSRKGIRIPVHRLAWRLHYGRWPTGIVDHINHCRTDNRISNLREASHSDNSCNKRVIPPTRLGRGVIFERGMWRVSVYKHRKRFLYPASHSISAVVASRLIRRIVHGEFTYEAEIS